MKSDLQAWSAIHGFESAEIINFQFRYYHSFVFFLAFNFKLVTKAL